MQRGDGRGVAAGQPRDRQRKRCHARRCRGSGPAVAGGQRRAGRTLPGPPPPGATRWTATEPEHPVRRPLRAGRSRQPGPAATAPCPAQALPFVADIPGLFGRTAVSASSRCAACRPFSDGGNRHAGSLRADGSAQRSLAKMPYVCPERLDLRRLRSRLHDSYSQSSSVTACPIYPRLFIPVWAFAGEAA